MFKLPYIFSEAQGIFLIRLLLSHILADFALQTRGMVKAKSWLSRAMVLHISIVAFLTFLFTMSWKITLFISITHWLIDSGKSFVQSKYHTHEHILFLCDQTLHILMLLWVWIAYLKVGDEVYDAIRFVLANYNVLLIIFSYAFVIWPLAYLLRFALQKMAPAPQNRVQNENLSVVDAGKLIGQFERIIILTFVFLNQYEAIGFLVTGKSIIRFADRNSELKSEYVLVGTMMSYGVSILTGLLVKQLIY